MQLGETHALPMTAVSFHSPFLNVDWPTGAFDGLGLEGAVQLGLRKKLEAEPEGPASVASASSTPSDPQKNGGLQ